MGAKEYDMSLMVALATTALNKLGPVARIANPKSAHTHYLAEYDWTEDHELDLNDLNDFLKDNLFKVDPSLLTTLLQIAYDTRDRFKTVCELHGADHEIRGQLAALIEKAEVCKKENTILATAVTLIDAPIKQKRVLRKAVDTDHDRYLITKCHTLVQHVLYNIIGKIAAKVAKVAPDG